MTLSEFLLARIAEDKEDVENSRIGDSPQWWMPDQWNRPRALAECEAKRKVVELVAEVQEGRHIASMTSPITQGIGLRILADMGRVYQDHPDYQPEWAL
jgi:hypothetical protein